MKKIVLTIVSIFYFMSSFCQSKVLYFKSDKVVKFQTWDTLYASVGKDIVTLSDSKGNRYKLKLGTDKDGSDAKIMITGSRYHIHGNPCQNGCVLMDEKMKLYFDEKAMPFTYYSSFVDHSSHMSHRSHNSHASHYSSSF